MQEKPSLKNCQILVTCPNCNADVLVGLKRFEIINACVAVPLFILIALPLLFSRDTVLAGIFVIMVASVLGVLIISGCKNNTKKKMCKSCRGNVVATYKDGTEGVQGWVTTFESTTASQTYSNSLSREVSIAPENPEYNPNDSQDSVQQESSNTQSNASNVYIHIIIIFVLIVLRINLIQPFGPKGAICNYVLPYTTTSGGHSIVSTIGGCLAVPKRR